MHLTLRQARQNRVVRKNIVECGHSCASDDNRGLSLTPSPTIDSMMADFPVRFSPRTEIAAICSIWFSVSSRCGFLIAWNAQIPNVPKTKTVTSPRSQIAIHSLCNKARGATQIAVIRAQSVTPTERKFVRRERNWTKLEGLIIASSPRTSRTGKNCPSGRGSLRGGTGPRRRGDR